MSPDATSGVLAVDVGNTVTRLGLFAHGVLAASWSLATPTSMTADEAYLSVLGFLSVASRGVDAAEAGAATGDRRVDATARTGVPANAAAHAPAPTDAIVSSVVPSLSDSWVEAARRLCGRRPLVVGPGLKTGLKMRYNDPSEIGADRIADLVAAKATYGAPVVVVDMGTTTNFEVLDEDGVFVGGIIAPGLRLSASALANAAARLAMVEVKAPASIIGKNTREAMQSGVVLGEVARIDGLVDMVWGELGHETSIVISGTDAAALAALSRHDMRVDDSLTLRGLSLLQQMNRKP